MTTFGWKKKAGEKVSKALVKEFSSKAIDESKVDPDADWLANAKINHMVMIEDSAILSERRTKEGIILAENERYWEAILKWNEAINLTPNNEKLHEMKAQALMILNEPFTALQAAEKAVQINPLWWEAHQTLGRAQLGIGEVKLAIKSFSKALHINPVSEEIWKDDLLWSLDILKKSQTVDPFQEKSHSDMDIQLDEEDEDDDDDSNSSSKKRKRKECENQNSQQKFVRVRI